LDLDPAFIDPAFITRGANPSLSAPTEYTFAINTQDPAHVGEYTLRLKMWFPGDPTVFWEEDVITVSITCTVTAVNIVEVAAPSTTPITYF